MGLTPHRDLSMDENRIEAKPGIGGEFVKTGIHHSVGGVHL